MTSQTGTMTECPSCGVQLRPDGSVDALNPADAESRAHYEDCGERCIGRRRAFNGYGLTVRCINQVLPGSRFCEVCDR